jgi:pSer/pThr/pTyr-binding forkhead associated (FHA) protein
MTGSAADTPATPDSLRASDTERNRATDALRQEFIDGRLSHDTFMFRMQSALGARSRGQLTGLFTDLPPRRARLLARVRAAFRRRDENPTGPDGTGPGWYPPGQASAGTWVSRGVSRAGGWPSQPVWTDDHVGPDDPAPPTPMFFPPGRGTSFTIGRTHDCDLRIANLSVSRCHARLDRSEDGWLLSDLGSHNGTRVNGWLVREPVPVRPGDLLQFGTATFLIKGPEGP